MFLVPAVKPTAREDVSHCAGPAGETAFNYIELSVMTASTI